MNPCGGPPDCSSFSVINELMAPVDETVNNLRVSQHLPSPWRCPSATAAGLMNDFSNVTQGSVVLDSYERSRDEDGTFGRQPPKEVKVFQKRKKAIVVLDNLKIRPQCDDFKNTSPVENSNESDEDETFRPKKVKVLQNRKKAVVMLDNLKIKPPDDVFKNPPPLEDSNESDEDETVRTQPPKKVKLFQKRKQAIVVLVNLKIKSPDDVFKNPPPVEDSNESNEDETVRPQPPKKVKVSQNRKKAIVVLDNLKIKL